jgi:hypothetical protein
MPKAVWPNCAKKMPNGCRRDSESRKKIRYNPLLPRKYVRCMCLLSPWFSVLVCTHQEGAMLSKNLQDGLLYQDVSVSGMQDVYWCFNVLYSLAINKKYIYNALYTRRGIFFKLEDLENLSDAAHEWFVLSYICSSICGLIGSSDPAQHCF